MQPIDVTITHIPSTFSVSSNGQTLRAADLQAMSPEAIAKLLAAGYKAAMRITLTAEQRAGGQYGKSAAELETLRSELAVQRHVEIVAGSFSKPTRLKPGAIERLMKDVALERIRAALSAKGLPMWSGKHLRDRVAELCSPGHSRYGDIRAEAEARLASNVRAADDSAEILGK